MNAQKRLVVFMDFPGLSRTLKDLDQISGLSSPGKHDFKFQGFYRICNNPENRAIAKTTMLCSINVLWY